MSGSIRVGDLDVYARDTQPELVRTRVGMVFQRPNLFPTLSIFDNVVAGLRMNGVKKRAFLLEAAEAALRQAALWDSVKNRLGLPAVRLSGGQQQRLCIARALAVEPEVLLLDEPCSALDPLSSAQIEELIVQLSSHITIALVTHNLFQATRISDRTAVFLLDDENVGTLVEAGPTAEIFAAPRTPGPRPTSPATSADLVGGGHCRRMAGLPGAWPTRRAGRHGRVSAMRRLVVGVDAAGRSCVVHETTFPAPADAPSTELIHQTTSSPLPVRPPGNAATVDLEIAPGIARWMLVQFQPGQRTLMHHTDTIDFDTIISERRRHPPG